jgi:ribonucleoside-diphosphate reductase alpha chain
MLRNDDKCGVPVLVREWEIGLEAFRVRHRESGDVANGLQFQKHPLMQMEGHPFDTVAWRTGPIEIKDEDGKIIFTEANAEFPESWGDRDKQVVASKYFFGDHSQGFRETSLRQMIIRVSYTIGLWALENGTFMSPADAENFLNYLMMIQLHQEFAFNSPVYFNVGVHCNGLEPSPENYIWDEDSQSVIPCPDANKYPQISACFIQSVDDDMASIMRLATSEAMLFKRGSGTGTDLSTLRSSRERLSGGGVPSGPVSFMGMYDRIAAIVKSGGKTRRAAKMQTLKYWHPDIWEFVECKPRMERMARDLIRAGWPKDFNGPVYSTVLFQNANLSVRVDDTFMAAARDGGTFDTRAVTTGDIVATYPAEKLLDAIAFGSHDCGDPAVQFEDTMQRWHTVPNHGPINSTNPCGEYVHIDDSACNLASVNLLRFRIASGQGESSWNRDHLFNTCRVAATAMETMVGRASYPTPQIALNSHRFRPLGGGYCNLGALLMVRGLPYDSPAGRLLGAALASLITGTFYLTSAELARRFGSFDAFSDNADEMMRVIEMHRQNFIDQLKNYDSSYGIMDNDRNLFDFIKGVWRNAIFMGRSWGYRNSQATCIAPTGTIGFMMGCDTLGIEPETALVRYKRLAGGGVIKLVNMCVPEALRGLGYSDQDINQIQIHMGLFGTIEDVILDGDVPDEIRVSSGLKPEHLPIFDCAFPPAPGELRMTDGSGPRKFRPREGRSIAPAGHVRMMGQATGSVSGAISKTVNMPESSTVEDIKQIYFEAWRAGCKSISVYRDGSKGDQPVTTAAPAGIRPVADPAPVESPGLPARFRMPDDRPATIHKFNIAGHEGFITVGYMPDGTPGEVFIEVAKQGSTVGGLMGVIGTLISILLQHYVPMSKIVEKLAGQHFEPRGITKNVNIRFCKSIVDYIGQYLGIHFVPGFQAGKNPVRADGFTPAASSGPDALEESLPAPMSGYAANLNGSICPSCGEIMVRVNTNCEVCSCGYTDGGCGG